MTLLDRVKDLAQKSGMSIAEIERKADLGNGSIRRWETSIPSADKLQRTAKVLGTSMDYLLNGTDSSSLDYRTKILARKVQTLSDEDYEMISSMIDRLKNSEKEE